MYEVMYLSYILITIVVVSIVESRSSVISGQNRTLKIFDATQA